MILQGECNVFLSNMMDESEVLAWGAIHIQPGILQVTRWTLGYSFSNHMLTTAQVWVRLYNLPLEYTQPQNIFNVARGVGLPLKINPKILNMTVRIYARVLVEIDLL